MRSAFDLSGQRILITGAAGGIGEITARVCASLGAALLLVDQRPTERLVQQLREAGSEAQAFSCDVASRIEVEALAASSGPVDALVMAAGICPWDDWQEPGWDEVFEQVMAVNLHGPIHLARAWLPRMIERKGGRMVLIGSVAGRIGGLVASAHYVAASRAARARQMARQARRAPWRPGQRHRARPDRHRDDPRPAVRSVADSARPHGRRRRDRLADVCSPAATYITGTVLDVNGGLYMN